MPADTGGQPAVVAALDDIRFALDDEAHAEFAWFAREYPRIFRYHLYHAEHRLESIHRGYLQARDEFEKQIAGSRRLLSVAAGRGAAWRVYWDFEAYLNAIGSGIDILARVVGLFYAEPAPVSFNKLCSKKELTGAADVLRQAQSRWVSRFKDYRDCFVHYTPVDNESYIQCVRYPSGWEVRCRIPTNPNIRESDGFRFSRRAELLRFALQTYRNVRALDRSVGRLIRAEWSKGPFPRRKANLFFVAPRQRPRNGAQTASRPATAAAGSSPQ